MIMAIIHTSLWLPVFYCDTSMGGWGRSKTKTSMNASTLDVGINTDYTQAVQ